MLRHRLIFGPIMIAVLLAGLWLDGLVEGAYLAGWRVPGGLVILVGMLMLVWPAGGELREILRGKGVPASQRLLAVSGMVGMVGLAVGSRLDHEGAALLGVLLSGVPLGAMFFYFRHKQTRGVALAMAGSAFAGIYLGVMPGFYVAMRGVLRGERGPWAVLALVLVVKFSDIGAYTVGRLFGRHKLIPWLSPGKTWEGMVGGLAFSAGLMLGCVALDRATGGPITPWWFAVVAGVFIGGIGQAGDLVASGLKRDAGVKDSGHCIPGFGGVIDVMDSPIVAAPAAYLVVIAARALGG